jgi:Mycobacterium membrane protein
LSNQPPSDPLQPWNPSQPYGPPGPDDAPPISGQPWSAPSGDPMADGRVQPPRPPQPGQPSVPYPTQPLPPAYQPGYAPLPPPGTAPEGYPGTAQFSTQPGYGPPPPPYGPGQPGQPPAPPPRKSNAPLIAVILAVSALLCGGAVTAGVLVVNNVADRAKEAVKPITDPTVPTLPTDAPGLPTDLPGLPTDLPGLPTDLPSLPTDLPGIPGSGKKITVEYEVTGDGPAEIVYTEKLGESPKRVSKAKLPWKKKVTMEGAALVSVAAVRSATDSGTISCRATVDGEEVAQRTREGTFATVSCVKMVLD